ncbi:MAG: response regulator [Sphingobium sp.]
MTSTARRILIAEDEAMISMMVEDYVDMLGHAVAATCTTNAQCVDVLDSGEPVDAALLDCNLGDGPVWETARRLKASGIPFAFASGDNGHGLPEDLRGAAVLGKPFMLDSLEQVLEQLLRN